jgi:16S rRNA (adenine1518-N6/adenine1519-N6)-dimethyltransferase
MSGLPPLREVIARHGLDARKALGQHFLLDLNITRKIARTAEVSPGDLVLEVGPGPGGLTRALLESGACVVAVERDGRCIAALEELKAAYPDKLAIVEGDALAFDERTALEGPAKIVANLPYNVSTELLVRWLRLNSEAPLWTTMTLMFQKEVADRIIAAPGSKAYGRLSVVAQAASRPKRAFDLPARAFTPPPKVDSSVLVFSPPPEPLATFGALERVTAAAFGQRRKMLRSSLRTAFGDRLEAVLSEAGIPETARAEDVAVASFVDLSAAA